MRALFHWITSPFAGERGDVGITTVAVITATVVAGSTLATVLIEVDTEVADELRQVVSESLSNVTNRLELRSGVVVADADGDGILDGNGGTVSFSVALGPGGESLALEEAASGSTLVVNVIAGEVHAPAAAHTITWLQGEGPSIEPGELAEISVSIPPGISVGRGAMVQIEVLAPAGSLLLIERLLPATFDSVAYLH